MRKIVGVSCRIDKVITADGAFISGRDGYRYLMLKDEQAVTRDWVPEPYKEILLLSLAKVGQHRVRANEMSSAPARDSSRTGEN